MLRSDWSIVVAVLVESIVLLTVFAGKRVLIRKLHPLVPIAEPAIDWPPKTAFL